MYTYGINNKHKRNINSNNNDRYLIAYCSPTSLPPTPFNAVVAFWATCFIIVNGT